MPIFRALFLLISFCASTAFAAFPPVYVAASGQLNVVMHQGHSAVNVNNGSFVRLDGGTGLQGEVGIQRSAWAAYVGYRHDANSDDQGSAARRPYLYGWRADYLLLGGRLFLRRVPQSTQPFLGAGISTGWATRLYKMPQLDSESVGPKLGAFGELGVKIPASSRLNVWLLGRLDYLTFHFQRTAVKSEATYLSQVTLHGGISYNFSK